MSVTYIQRSLSTGHRYDDSSLAQVQSLGANSRHFVPNNQGHFPWRGKVKDGFRTGGQLKRDKLASFLLTGSQGGEDVCGI